MTWKMFGTAEPDVLTEQFRQCDTKNLLLRSLSAQDFALLAPHLTRVPFSIGDPLSHAGDAIDSLCFPEEGIAGVLDALDGDHRYAVGLIGAEGFVGWPLLLGNSRSPYDVVMRAERGEALRIAAEHFVAAAKLNPNDGIPFRFLGHHYARGGDTQRAAKCYQRAVALNADDAEAGVCVGMLSTRIVVYL